MTTDYNTIKAAAESLPADLHTMLHLATIVPAVVFDPESPMQDLLAPNGLLNGLGKAVLAWMVVTGEGYPEASIATAKAVLRAVGIEVCEGCRQPMPNVGKWRDGLRFCGGCKVREAVSKPGFVDGLENELSAALQAVDAMKSPCS